MANEKLEMKDMAKNEASEAIEKLMKEVNELKESTVKNTENFAQKAKEKTKDWQESVCHYVQENPGKTLLIALGVGALLGFWKKR